MKLRSALGYWDNTIITRWKIKEGRKGRPKGVHTTGLGTKRSLSNTSQTIEPNLKIETYLKFPGVKKKTDSCT